MASALKLKKKKELAVITTTNSEKKLESYKNQVIVV